MRYSFQPNGRSFRIVIPNEDIGFLFGHVDVGQQPFKVRNPDGKTIAQAEDLHDALSVLLDYHEKHPAQWEQDSATEYSKDTPCGLLSVQHEPLGFWSVSRNLHTILLHDGKPATFRTAEEAKEAADAHLRDDLGKTSEDGFEWFSMARN